MSTSWPIPKDPNAVLDYQFDWSAWLQPGEQITNSDMLVDQGTVVIDNKAVSGGLTTVWLSGGVAGEVCLITNRVTTDQGRTDDKTGKLRIRQR